MGAGPDGAEPLSHSLALFMRLISFSSLMASVMSPLIRSFPDMKARVGFSFPETAHRTTQLLPRKQHRKIPLERAQFVSVVWSALPW